MTRAAVQSSSVLPATPGAPSLVRAWLYLVWLSLARQARMRQMVWIAFGLLGFSATFVAVVTAAQGWDLTKWRWAGFLTRDNQRIVYNYREGMDGAQAADLALPFSSWNPRVDHALYGSAQTVFHDPAFLDNASFTIFTRTIVLSESFPSLLLNFLLPIWSLSFATNSVGEERESRSLIWLLTRPLPRPLIYLAKFVAVLPWTLGFNVGGFGLLCLLGGKPGRDAFVAFWPAVACSTLAFSALFMLIGTYFRRPAVVAIVYSFFLEVILGNMPGFLKRASISFYARCMMYEAVADRQIGPATPLLFLAVDGTTALVVLLTATVGLLVVGLIVFTHMEYHEVA
jgi:ABC-type transport system involved in multi-copper enzyme maturation permease subunit